MTGRLPRRVRGAGWEVWLDEAGILWTRDTQPMGPGQAQVRVEAMERYLARAAVRGVLVDDREPAGPDPPEAWAVWRRFVATHPGLPFAIVTPDPRMVEGVLDARAAAAGSRLAVFRAVEPAVRWLDEQAPREGPGLGRPR